MPKLLYNKILIIGAAGFIAFHLPEIICQLNFNVISSDNLPTQNNRYEIILFIEELRYLLVRA